MILKKGYLVVLLVGCLLLFIFSLTYSYDNSGTSARAVGMGGSFIAVADDPSAVFYNPAGLVQLKEWQMYFMYDKKTMYGVSSSENPYLGAAVVAIPLSRDIAIALAGYQDGSWADPTTITTKNLGLLSFSSWVTDELSVGLNLKGLYNSNYGKKSGFDFDLGLLYKPCPWLNFGFMGENLMRTDMVPEGELAFGYQTRQAKFGLAYRYENGSYQTCLALDNAIKDVNQPQQKSYNLTSIGLEQWLLTDKDLSFAIRGGYTFGEDYELDYSQPSGGASIRYRADNFNLQLDYAWSKYPYKSEEDFAGDHRVDLVFSYQGKVKRDQKLLLEKQEKKPEKKYVIKREEISYPPEPAKRETTIAPSYVLTYDLKSEVEYLSVGRNRSVMFLLNPLIDMEIKRWRLYIWSNRPIGWDKDEIEQFLLKTFEGGGKPPFGVMWDCRYNNVKVKKGTYYYALVLKDQQNRKWYSQIKSFKLN